jgi:hypothetical protein
MHEIVFLLVSLTAIGLLGYLITIITPQLFSTIGLFMLLAGLAEGIPTGFWYHVVLRRILIQRGHLPQQSHPPTPGAFTPTRPEPAGTGSSPVGRAPSHAHPPTPGAFTPARPEPAKTGTAPVGRAPSHAHPPTPGVVAPARPEPAKTGTAPGGRAPSRAHPPTPGAFSPARPEPAETGAWPVGRPPSRWWIHPTRFHAQLTPEEYRRIRLWFVLGGIGYAIAVTGGLAAIIGLLIQRL